MAQPYQPGAESLALAAQLLRNPGRSQANTNVNNLPPGAIPHAQKVHISQAERLQNNNLQVDSPEEPIVRPKPESGVPSTSRPSMS